MSLNRSIGLAPTASDVTRFNIWFDQQCVMSGIEQTMAADIKLCVNEVLANLISYGFGDTSAPLVAVEIELRPGYARAKIIDNGTYFDVRDWPPVQKDRDLLTAPPGGFGIALIKERATWMSYKRAGDINEFEIVCEAG